jgi:uncharacterized protein YneF (UPF0154 family)
VSTFATVMLIIVIILAAVLVGLYFLGRRTQKKRAEQQEIIDQSKQSISMLVIDKKKMKINQAGLPDIVVKEVPWYLKRSKIPIVKAKVGPQIMTFIADAEIYDSIPVKKEVKATITGLYITGVKGLRKDKTAQPVKKGFMAKLRSKANGK